MGLRSTWKKDHHGNPTPNSTQNPFNVLWLKSIYVPMRSLYVSSFSAGRDVVHVGE